MRETRVDGVKRVFDGHFKVDEATVAYQKPDGSWSEPTKRLSVERGDAVAVIIFDTDAHALTFVRQFRYPTRRHGEPWLLEIVAGNIDPSETALEAARREAKEEVGMDLGDLEKVAEMFGSPGGLSEKVTIFSALGERTSRGGGLEGEDVEIVQMSVEEALDRMDRGEIHDGKTLVALQWLALRRRGV